MKKVFTSALIFCSLLISCKNNGQSTTDSSDSGNSSTEKKISKRDLTVTKANAYNDIFLDSMALEKFIGDNKIPDSLSRRMRSFYNARNYQFAWFSSRGLTEQGLTFWNMHSYETTAGDTALKNKALESKMNNLVADSTFAVSPSDKSMVNTEFLLTEHFLKHTLDSYEKGYVKRKEMERFVPIKKEDPLTLADSLLNKKHKDDKYFEDVNNAYKLLKVELNRYVEVAKKADGSLEEEAFENFSFVPMLKGKN